MQIPKLGAELDRRSSLMSGDWEEEWVGHVQVIEQMGTSVDKTVEPRRKRGAGFAQFSDGNRPTLPVLGAGISSLLHKFGINVRHIGLLRTHVMHPHIRFVLFLEMVARTSKNLLRQALRNRLQAMGDDTSPHQLKQVVVHFLNQLTGSAHDSTAFWQNELLSGMNARFGIEAPEFLEADCRSDLFQYLITFNDMSEQSWQHHNHVVKRLQQNQMHVGAGGDVLRSDMFVCLSVVY